MISRLAFEEAYKKFTPCKIEQFYFKYFSIHTFYTHPWIIWAIAAVLLVPFMLGFIFHFLGLSTLMTELPMIIICGVVTIFSIIWIIIWRLHKLRMRKVRKFLGLSKLQLKQLSYKYYFSRYNDPELADLTCYIKNKCKK